MTYQMRIPSKVSRFGIDTGLFFLLFYLYVWLVIDPRLIHHSVGIAIPYYPFSFHSGWEFFGKHLARPGGLAAYGARFLTQFYCFGWVGALIVMAAAWYACRCVDFLSRCAGQPRGHFLRYAPAGLLLIMYGAYNHPFGALLSLLAALSGFMLYVHQTPQVLWKRLLVLALRLRYSLPRRGRGEPPLPAHGGLLGTVYRGPKARGSSGFAVWPGGSLDDEHAMGSWDLEMLYTGFLNSDPGVWPPRRSVYTLVLYLIFPAVLAGTVTWRRLLARCRSRETGDSPSRVAALLATQGTLFQTASTVAAVLAVAEAAALSLDSVTGTKLRIDYYWRSANNGWRHWRRLSSCRPAAWTRALTATRCWHSSKRGCSAR